MDARIKKGLNEAFKAIEQFADENFAFTIVNPNNVLSTLSKTLSKELVYIAGCVAVGGPNGAEGWQELFADPEWRVQLVIGVIGRLLKEHVFDSLMFGGTAEDMEDLHDLEVSTKDEDGMFSSP